MFKFIFSLFLGTFSLNSAWAESFLVCNWDPSPDLIASPSLSTVIEEKLQLRDEQYNCRRDDEGLMQCDYKTVWIIPNITYSTTVTATISCINIGNKTERITYKFAKASDSNIPVPATSLVWKNLTMRLSGAGSQRTFSNIETMEHDKLFTWSDTYLAPCQKNCWDLSIASPRYSKNLQFTFSVQPKVFKTAYGYKPYYDLQDSVGALWIVSGANEDVALYTFNSPYLSICGLAGNGVCNPSNSGSSVGGGTGGGPIRPPIRQCTLTVVTPDVVVFQPISSDDLSRGRVRSEDFTMTVIKGPDQSTPCLGSVYNLPGEIKTQGGYPISSTFWGISHSSGAPQGIGLKLYDLERNTYLNFNQTYSSFINDISSISESKRIRAEISATTTDLKKIRDGEYSQVLTFEVAMP